MAVRDRVKQIWIAIQYLSGNITFFTILNLKRVYNEKFGDSRIVSNAPYGSWTVVMDGYFTFYSNVILF